MAIAPHRSHQLTHKTLIAGVVIALVITAILYSYGVSWWYTPIAVVGVSVLSHLTIAVGVLLLASTLMRKGAKGSVPHAHGGDLIRRPKLYDLMVRVLAFGKEERMRRRWLELAELKTGDAVLDVGCGTGTLLLAAAQHVGPTGSLNGIEAAPEMVEYARGKAAELEVVAKLEAPAQFDVGSADELPYPDESFDVAFCTLVLHHLPLGLQRSAVREMQRVVRPGGRVLVVDMHHKPGSFRRMLSLITVLHGGQSGKLLDIAAELESLGLNDVGEHSGGNNALVATRGRLAVA